MNICYIIGAGECAPMDFDPGETDLLIAADGGYRAVCDAGMRPDLIVGDFDSLGGVPTDAPVIRCPVEKDDTDTMIAIKEGLARGYQRFQIYGGLGGRLDHTIANLHALAYLADHGARGRLVGVARCGYPPGRHINGLLRGARRHFHFRVGRKRHRRHADRPALPVARRNFDSKFSIRCQ